MACEKHWAVLALAAGLVGLAVRAEEKKPYTGAACTRAADDYFTREVWPKVAAPVCLTCHVADGDADGSKLVLRDPQKLRGAERDAAMQHNRDLFARIAAVKHEGRSRLLVKATGGLKHGGNDVLKPDSKGYQVLAEFVRRLSSPATGAARPAVEDKTPFFDGVVLLEPKRLLRRVTLSLAGRLPSEAELAVVSEKGMDGLSTVLDVVMKEEAFYDRPRGVQRHLPHPRYR
ncbi:MAG: hypothetical protein U0736_17350 [Gemmataceae bacterium]